MHSLKHYKVLHENNVILTVVTASKPWVSSADRARVSQYNERFMQVTLTFGYMQQPNIPRALGICRKLGWKFDIMTTSFFLSRRSLKASAHSGLPLWQDKLFILLAHGIRRNRIFPDPDRSSGGNWNAGKPLNLLEPTILQGAFPASGGRFCVLCAAN